MPWCQDCEKYWTPSSVNEDGSCPRCGADLDPPAIVSGDGSEGDAGKDEKTPWHFKLMIVALVVYLGYRFVEIFIKIVN